MTDSSRTSADPFGIVDGHAPAEQYEQPEADKKLAKRIEELYRQSSEARSSYDRAWDLHRCYLKGEQITVHKETGEYVRVDPRDAKRLHSRKNVLRPVARSLVGKGTRAIPAVRVSPPTGDFDDIHSSQAADALLRYLRRKEELELKYQEAWEYLPWAGNAFLMPYWNRDAGQTKAHCEVCGLTEVEELIDAPCPQCQIQREQELAAQAASHEMLQSQAAMAALGNPSPDPVTGEPVAVIPEVPPPPMEQLGPLAPGEDPRPMTEVKTGDCCVDVIDPRDLYPEPGAESIKKMRWFLVRRLLPVSTIRSLFPKFALFIRKETVAEPHRDAAWGDLGTLENSPDSYDNHAYLFECHEAPSEAYRKGRIIWMVNGFIVGEVDHPYYKDLGRFNLFHIGWDKNSGEFFYEPFIQQAWHRQKELNNNETALREHTEMLLKSKVLIPLGSRITTDEFTASSAQVIAFNRAAGEPLKWDPPQVPPDLWQRGAMLEADVRQFAGITDADVGMSQTDPNGRAMAIIQAEADQQLGPVTRRNNSEYRDLNKALLIIELKFASPDHVWTVSGPDGTEVYYLYDVNLKDQVDVELEDHDGMSENPAIRLQQNIDLANLGYYIDPMSGLLDKKAFARAARLNDPGAGYDMEATERAAARAIPKKIERGEMIQPHTFDDPLIFGEVLLAWLRGPGRRADPMLVMQVEQIWQFYVMWALSGMMPGVGFPAISQGLGGPMGGGPSPMNPEGGPGAGGPDQSAPGGSANNPGHLGTDLSGGSTSPIAAGAQARVGIADRRGEQGARVQSQREG